MLPTFSTLEPNQGPISSVTSGIDERLISADPRELWYLALPQKLTPTQVVQILRSSQGGDVWQQFQLNQLMLDCWPMLKKCNHELCSAAASVRYIAKPYCEEGKEPTKSAKAKSDLVNRCFKNMTPDKFSDEKGFRSMVYQMAGGFSMGLMVEEMVWDKPRRYPGIGMERRLKAGAFVHPRHYTFTDAGTLALFDDSYNRLYFNLAKARDTGVNRPDPRKFVCGQYYSPSGSTLGSGFMRPLAPWFTAVVFNFEWMARMAQNWGSPFLDVLYKAGMTPTELAQLDANIKKGLANRWVRHIEGTELKVTPGQALGSENPQRYLMEQADRLCQLLYLGQTLTSDTSDNGGSLALGKVHQTVRQDRIEDVAKWIASEPLTDVGRAIVLVNYGETDECPAVEADFTKPLTALEQAQYLQTISNVRIPLLAEEVYMKSGMTMPEEGDKVLIGGQVGSMSSQEVPLGPEADMQRQQEMMESQQPQQHQIEASLKGKTPEELEELEQLVTAAERTNTLNGEWESVRIKLMDRR